MINRIFKFFFTPSSMRRWSLYWIGVWLTMLYLLENYHRNEPLNALMLGLMWPIYWFMWTAVRLADML